MPNEFSPERIPSQRYSLWDRVLRRFALEPGLPEAAPPAVSRTIIPTFDADLALSSIIFKEATLSLTTTSGTFKQAFLVPANKRWKIVALMHQGTVGSTRFKVKETPDTTSIIFDLSVSVTAQFNLNPVGLWLNSGSAIGLSANGNGSDTSIDIRVILMELEYEL